MTHRCLYFEKPLTVTVRESTPPAATEDRLLVQVHCSAISAGTEMLVFEGRFPEGLAVDATLSAYDGQRLAYPLRYGYSSVGTVVAAGPQADKSWVGERVFAFQPHQSHFAVPAVELVRIPEGVAEEDAVFLASMETAVNLVMDGRPVIGERVLMLGQGIVGLLTTALLARFPLNVLGVIEPWPLRRRAAADLGAHSAWGGDEAGWAGSTFEVLDRHGADLVYELSGQPALLNTAIEWAGFDGRIVVGSWYGAKTAPLAMGGRFHRNRLQLISSQVSTLGPGFSGRWTKARRLGVAWDLIAKVKPSKLISHRFGIEDAQHAYEQIAERMGETLQVLLTYGVPTD